MLDMYLCTNSKMLNTIKIYKYLNYTCEMQSIPQVQPTLADAEP